MLSRASRRGNSTFGCRSIFRVNKCPSLSTEEPLHKQNKTMLSICLSIHFILFFLFCLPLLRASWPQPQVSSSRQEQEVGKEKVCVLSLHFFHPGLPRERLGNIPLASRLLSAAQAHSVATWPGSALAWINLTRREITWVNLAPVQCALVGANVADVTRLVHTCPSGIHLQTLLSLLQLYIARLNLWWCAESKADHRQRKPDSKIALSSSYK